MGQNPMGAVHRNGTRRKTLLILTVATDFCTRCQNAQTSPRRIRSALSQKRLVFVVLNEFNMLCLHLFLRQVYGPSTCVYKTVRSILDYLLSAALRHIFTPDGDLQGGVYTYTRVCTRIDVIAGAILLSDRHLNNIGSSDDIGTVTSSVIATAAAGFWRAETLVK